MKTAAVTKKNRPSVKRWGIGERTEKRKALELRKARRIREGFDKP